MALKDVTYIRSAHVDGVLMEGAGDVLRIEQHEPQGEGDRFYYDVRYRGGATRRFFDVVETGFDPGGMLNVTGDNHEPTRRWKKVMDRLSAFYSTWSNTNRTDGTLIDAMNGLAQAYADWCDSSGEDHDPTIKWNKVMEALGALYQEEVDHGMSAEGGLISPLFESKAEDLLVAYDAWLD